MSHSLEHSHHHRNTNTFQQMFPQNPLYAEQTNAVTTSADSNHPSAIFAQHSCAGPSITDTLSAVQCTTRPLPVVLSSCICQKRPPDPEAMWQQGVAPPNASGLHWTQRTAEHSTGMSSKLGWALGTGNIFSPDHKEMGTWPKHHFYSEKNACFTSFCDFPQLIIMKGSIQAFLSHITFLQNRVASVSKTKAVPGFLQSED